MPFQHDPLTHVLETQFVTLQGELHEAATRVGICNLQLAELVKRYAKHNKLSRDEATLILIRLAKLVRNGGPNF